MLEHWTDARLLEDALETVRSKYDALFQQVIEQIQRQHRELDYAKAKAARYGELGIGKDSWPKNKNDWPTGFYVGNLRLENLTDFQSEAPYKSVWVAQVKDSKEAEARLKKAATRILGGDEYQELEFERKEHEVSCWRWLEESRQDLLKLLVEDDSQGFIDCLARHFDWMIRFAGVIDECVNCKKSGK